jgi:hypothetical protein
MPRFDILFETDSFNVSQVKEHFINPCCFGEDLAQWLGDRLTEKGVITAPPGQEDWGWYLFGQRGPERYFLGVCGYRCEDAVGKNEGEWRIMVERRRSLWDKIRVRNKITDTDPILSIIEDILREQKDVRNMRREQL